MQPTLTQMHSSGLKEKVTCHKLPGLTHATAHLIRNNRPGNAELGTASTRIQLWQNEIRSNLFGARVHVFGVIEQGPSYSASLG